MTEKRRLEDEIDEFSGTPVREQSEIEGVANVLFEDKEDPNTGMSSIDQRSILHPDQIPTMSSTEILGELGVIPQTKNFTRKFKRHAISQNGIGREQIVRASGGIQDQRSGMGVWDKIGGLFKPKQHPPQ